MVERTQEGPMGTGDPALEAADRPVPRGRAERFRPLRGRRGRVALGGLALLAIFASGLAGYFGAQLQDEPAELSFVIGGAADDPFIQAVLAGAHTAADEHGFSLNERIASWDETRLLAAIIEEVQAGPKGVAFPGHPGSEALDGIVEEGLAAGVRLTAYNVDPDALRRRHAGQGFGYVGANSSAIGVALAEEALRTGLARPGERALVLSTTVGRGSQRVLRSEGALQGLLAGGVQAESLATGSRLERMVLQAGETLRPPQPEELDAFLRRNLPAPPALVVFDSPRLAHAVVSGLPSHPHWKVEGVRFATYDLDANTLAALSDGSLDLVYDQEAFLQGYLAVLQLILSIERAAAGVVATIPGQGYTAARLAVARERLHAREHQR